MSEMTIGLIINLVFCIFILVFGIWGYIRNKMSGSLYMGISFAFYGIAHIISLMGLAESLNVLSITVRVIGYILTVMALYKFIYREARK